MNKKYYIGLDIGTDSCGWAVTDGRYNILKAKGQKLWGVRLFKDADRAEDRRSKRTARRRLVRKKLQLQWLREIFKPEIDKIDKTMLDRIKYSSLYLEDKQYFKPDIKSKDSLFCGEVNGQKFTDKEFYATYPTVYHLRKELLNKPAQDIRFLYLALHNIIKRRGHFLYEGDFADNQSLSVVFDELFGKAKGEDIEFVFPLKFEAVTKEQEAAVINEVLRKGGLRQTKQNFISIFKAENKSEKAVVSCFVDGKINLKEVFPFDTETELKLNFQSENFDNEFDEISSELTDEIVDFVLSLKNVYSTIQLKKLLGNSNYICEAMVDKFDEHHNQLRFFKDFVKKFFPQKYNDIFRLSQKEGDKAVNYAVYVNGSIYDGEKRVVAFDKRDKEDFYKYVRNILEKNRIDDEEYRAKEAQILEWIEANNFLNKQRTKDNAVLPNKLYEKEVAKILETNKAKFSFLADKDESGLSNAEKIVEILKFRVPYFVGPIGGAKEGEETKGWIVRDKSFDFKPWNYEKMVNFDEAEEKFIANMTNKCAYLKDKDVLPKNSLLFSKFKVLNELNRLSINGNNISVKLKQDIFNNLFAKENKVTTGKLKTYLKVNNKEINNIAQEEINDISFGGIDNEFASNFGVYAKFVKSPNFGKDFVDKHIDLFEKIIKYHTVISDKNRLAQRIKREFGDILNAEQIKELKGLNFQGWGSLSKEFLQDLTFVDKKTGERTNIIDRLWETNQNLQQILFNSDYSLQEEIKTSNNSVEKGLTYSAIEGLYCAPSVKRGIWQTVKVLREIVDVMGNPPEKIFVEVTREDGEKGDAGRKLSRRTNLEAIYNSKEFRATVKKSAIELEELFNELSKKDDSKLRSDKLFLYFMQLGRCAYSGEKIDIQDVFDNNLYDVDHIIPQSKIKDDSIINKVLVKKEYNEMKTDNFPIAQYFPDWVKKQKPFWQLLVKLNLMQPEKYARLVRMAPLTEDELGGFIARQLVETNQTNKAVIDLLEAAFAGETKVIYSKAKFVSDFRNKYKIFKSRTINDLHHAKDAYLNIVVGDVLHNRFTENPRNFYKNKDNNQTVTKNYKNIFDYRILSWKNKDEVIWNGKEDMLKVKAVCQKDDCLVSKMTFSDMNGAFYDETIYKKGEVSGKVDLISLKGAKDNPISNVNKYGGYSKLKNAYFMVVEGEKKGKKLKLLVSVPILLLQTYRKDENKEMKILEFVEKENDITNAKILIPKINFHSLFKIGKGYYRLGGKTGENFVLHNAIQWTGLSQEMVCYVKAIEKFIDIKNMRKDNDLKEIDDKVVLSKPSKEGNKEIALTRENNNLLYEEIIRQLSKEIYCEMPLEAIKETMISAREKFDTLSVKDQSDLLYRVMLRVSTGAKPADLSLIGGGKAAGVITIGKNITDKNIVLIQQSPTGLFEKKVKL